MSLFSFHPNKQPQRYKLMRMAGCYEDINLPTLSFHDRNSMKENIRNPLINYVQNISTNVVEVVIEDIKQKINSYGTEILTETSMVMLNCWTLDGWHKHERCKGTIFSHGGHLRIHQNLIGLRGFANNLRVIISY